MLAIFGLLSAGVSPGRFKAMAVETIRGVVETLIYNL
jgi:hypothetical protein